MSQEPNARTPEVLVFDVNETLLDLAHLEPLFERLFGDPAVLGEWFDGLIRLSQTVTLARLYQPFSALGAGVLKALAAGHGRSLDDADLAELRERTQSMPAHADAGPALRKLADAGFRLVTLTNSAPVAAGPTPLQRAGLAPFFERAFSVDAVRRFKPDPATYNSVASGLGLGCDALCLVAAHTWDVLGAQAAGCRGALVARGGTVASEVEGLPRPDLVGKSLDAVADGIIARWR